MNRGIAMTKRISTALLSAVALLALAATAQAGPREQAKRIHDRLTGVPPTAATLATMEAQIVSDPVAAALTAIDNPDTSAFYNVTLKNFAAPWTNRDQTVFVPLNDYIALIIGMVRDEVDFRQILSGDMLYVGSGGGLPGYSMANNDHYEQMELQGLDLKAVLQQTTQSSATSLPPNATAGVMTTRAAAEAFFIAGTNRAMFRFTMLNHLCNDMEQVQNNTYAPDRIRRDVSRSPGGDSRVFLNNCIGCHSGMDPLAQAFAYYNFDEGTGSIEYTDGVVQPKYFNNEDNFQSGFNTPDDSWDNYWREGQNSLLGWSSSLPGSGQGAKTLGEELANSTAFAQCQVEKVFKNVCFREPEDTADRTEVSRLVGVFQNSTYNLKQVFAETAVYCMGQ